MPNRKQFKRTVIILIAVYVAIFAARTVYNLVTYDDQIPGGSVNYAYNNLRSDFAVQNFASERKEYIGTAGTQVLDQKYERVASTAARTAAYDDDLSKLNASIEESQAVVQMENEQGLPGSRRLTRAIGVKPEYFDVCLEAIRSVGTPISSVLQKTDKTYEYRQMLAQKQELEKRLESYVMLRSHEGSINERLNLEDKIIEVESQLLKQAVDLGEYSDENALCTINVSLYERGRISVANKIWNAFLWTNGCYFPILGCVVGLAAAAVVLVKAYRFLGAVLKAGGKKNKADTK